jgi:hypothetical protein
LCSYSPAALEQVSAAAKQWVEDLSIEGRYAPELLAVALEHR